MKSTMTDLEKRIFVRLLAFLMPAVLIAFMDRINISFAAPTMNNAIGIDSKTFGLGAGIFFLGYMLLEIPSNVVLARVGARFWISRIMIVWGLVAAAMSLAVGPASFLSLRFLLGVAEAGFVPGIVLYASYWIAPARLGTFTSWMLLAIPVAGSVTALISGVILSLDGVLGMQGWQWVFVLEGLPAVVLGFYGLAYLPSRPRDAGWLSDAEKQLVEESTRPIAGIPAASSDTALEPTMMLLRRISTNPQVLAYSFAYMFVNCALGAQPWLPLLLAPLHPSALTIPVVLGVGNLLAAIGMVAWGKMSDRAGERLNHLLAAGFVSAIGWFLCGYGEASEISIVVGVTLALIGVYAFIVVFWALPAATIKEAERPVGIAVITAVGLVGSFVAPIVTGWLKEAFGSYAGGMYIAAGGMLLGALLARIGTVVLAPSPPGLPHSSAST